MIVVKGLKKKEIVKLANKRKERILSLRRKGLTFKEIGLIYKIGVERTRQVYLSALRKENILLIRTLNKLQIICQELYRKEKLK